MAWRVRLQPELAASVIRALPPATKRAIRAALRKLAQDPLDPHLDVRELDAPPQRRPMYRLRIGDWRMVFVVEAREVRVIKVFHRRDGYGWLERMGRLPGSGERGER